jgi:hypothetical protein
MIPLPCPIPFSAWPDLSRLHNLAVRRVIADDALQLTLVIDLPPGAAIWPCDPGVKTMPEAKKKLSAILSQMYAAARATLGSPIRRELPGGLRIDILIGDKDGLTKLQLSRQLVFPSDPEWTIVITNLPYDPPMDIHPTKLTSGDRHYLKAAWQTSQV